MTQRVSLPGVLQEIADVAGIDAAWALARAKGGREVFLPKIVPHRHWLTAIVGQDAAQKICTHFRGNHQMRVLIPMGKQPTAEQWAEALNSGMTRDEMAEALGVHIRTVSRHRARGAADPNQGDLF
jgi:hypothetical protein